MCKLIDRFMDKVEIVPESGCWIWTGGMKDDRYGSFYIAGQCVRAHRFSVEYFHGIKIPDGHVIIHECDNTLCVNPNHLRSGTQSENILDCVSKGRHNSCQESVNAM